MNNIERALQTIKKQIRDDAIRYHREPSSISLLAVSKKQSLEKMEAAIRAGQKAFGENYLQECLNKINVLAHHAIEWHFIGPVQSNKTKKIAELFAWVHTVSDRQTAKRLNDQRPSDLPPLNICIQVNSSDEISKSGVAPDQVLELAQYCDTLPRLALRGLMTMPAPKNTFDEQRTELHKLRLIYDELNKSGFKLDTLSMGMSNDMDAAIAEGATIVRIGTAIFGERAP